MMNQPIVLCPPRSVETFDDAGITIIKSILPNTTSVPGPYESISHSLPSSYVPSLAYFSIRRLVEYPDAVHILGGPCLRYQPSSSFQTSDIIRALIPFSFHLSDDTECFCALDPRLWALLVQIYSNLPKVFRRFILPLSDRYLPLLNHIPSGPNFTVITVLELPRCTTLTDDTISELKLLHGLCALDASETALTSHGVQRLSWTLTSDRITQTTHRGPWRLRILRLRNCRDIDDSVITSIVNFPLLCVVDLRGTKCIARKNHGSFKPSPHPSLFYPVATTEALDNLIRLATDPSLLFPHPEPFIIHVNSLSYSRNFHPKSSRKPQANPDIFTLLPVKQEPVSSLGAPSKTSSRTIASNSTTLNRVRLRESELDFFLRYELGHPGQEDPKVNLDSMLEFIQQNAPSVLDKLGAQLDSIVEKAPYPESSIQALQRFYGTVPSTAPECQCPYMKPASNYYKPGQQSSLKDNLLMLYRSPLPWNDIPGSSSTSVESSMPTSRNARSLASVDRESTKARQGRHGILSMITERKRTSNVGKSCSIPRTSETTRSKNPFARRARSTNLTTNKRLRVPPHEGDASVREQKPFKELKPISSLPIPVLPTQSATPKKTTKTVDGLASDNSAEPERKKQTDRQTTLPGMFFTRRQ